MSDDGLKHLGGLIPRDWLSLNNTQVSDNGLMHLTELPNLIRLELTGTRVTEEGVKELQVSIPDCHIEY